MPARVGSLDHPQRLGCRSVAVYENATGGYFIKPWVGGHDKLHGAMRWTTTSGIQMRGRSVFTAAPRHARASPAWEGSDESMSESDEDEDEEQRQIDLAIERSLQQDVGPPAPAAIDAGQAPAGQAPTGDAASPAVAGNVAPASGSHNCLICLDENAACMLCVPCNHMVSCQACSRHLRGRPCPMCRRNVTRVTRVFF